VEEGHWRDDDENLTTVNRHSRRWQRFPHLVPTYYPRISKSIHFMFVSIPQISVSLIPLIYTTNILNLILPKPSLSIIFEVGEILIYGWWVYTFCFLFFKNVNSKILWFLIFVLFVPLCIRSWFTFCSLAIAASH
jgi:hypothetical protein